MPPPKKDNVHRYFNYNEAKKYSKCKLCEKNIKGKHTSNLKSHLATKHTAEFQIVSELNKTNSPPPATTTTKPNDPPEMQQSTLIEKIKKYCARLVTEHGRPINMIEDIAFQELISLACSKQADLTKQIHIKAIENTVHEQASLIKIKIWSEIKNKLLSIKIDSVICVERKFLGFNVQYIKNGRIVIRNLAIYEVHEPQTGSFLKSTLEEVLTDFQISTKNLYSICTDNGANMIKTMKLVGGKYYIENESGPNHDEDESDEEEEQRKGLGNMGEAQNNKNNAGEEERLGDDYFSTGQNFNVQDLVFEKKFNIRGMLCPAHILQLAIKDAIAENVPVQSLLSLARSIVHILRRPNNRDALKSAQQLKAIIDCPTRWTTTYNMLKRLLTLRDFIGSIQEVSLLTSPVFWTELTSVIECLKPANEATLKLQREDLTIGDFYILWANCKNFISANDHKFANSLTRSMQARESKLLNNDVVLECLYIDRRLNVILNDQQCEKAKSLLKETHRHLQKLHQIAENVDADDKSDINQQGNEAIAVPSTSQGTLDLESFLMKAEKARGLSRPIKSFDFCLNEFILGPRLPISENIVNHWNNAAVYSSDLAMVANTVLAAPSTQASVGRLFSSLKFILNPLRNNLNQHLLRDIMLIRQNKDLLE